MRDHGAIPCTYTADLGQYDEPDIDVGPRPRPRLRRRDRPRWWTAARRWSRRAWPPSPAAPSTSAPAAARYFNTTPLGRAVAGTLLVRAMHEDGVRSGATARPTRATTSSASTATACWPTPRCGSTSRGSTPTSSASSAAARRCREWLARPGPALPGQHREGVLDRRQHLGATHEAKTLEHLDARLEIVEPIMGVAHWDPAVAIDTEDVTVAFEQGRPVAINGTALRRRRRAVARGQRHRRPSRPRACPTRSRTGSSRPRAGASTRRPGMALLYTVYERLVNAIHNEATIATYHNEGRQARPAAVRGPLVRPAVDDAPRVAPALGGLGGDRRGDPAAAPRRGLHDPATPTAQPSPTTRTSCPWSAPRTPPSAPRTASAS